MWHLAQLNSLSPPRLASLTPRACGRIYRSGGSSKQGVNGPPPRGVDPEGLRTVRSPLPPGHHRSPTPRVHRHRSHPRNARGVRTDLRLVLNPSPVRPTIGTKPGCSIRIRPHPSIGLSESIERRCGRAQATLSDSWSLVQTSSSQSQQAKRCSCRGHRSGLNGARRRCLLLLSRESRSGLTRIGQVR